MSRQYVRVFPIVKPLKTSTLRDDQKCPSYRGVRLTIVRLIEVFLWETHLSSAGTCGSVRLREVSVLWDVRLERFHCTSICAAGCRWFLNDFRFSGHFTRNIRLPNCPASPSKQLTARRRLGVFVLLYTDRHLSTYHVRNLFKIGYGEFLPSFLWHQCRRETQWLYESSLYLFLKMANWKLIFLGPFLPSMRNYLFVYLCRRLSHVSLIWSDVFCFLWWILYINSCLPLFLHHKSLENEYAYHIMKSRI